MAFNAASLALDFPIQGQGQKYNLCKTINYRKNFEINRSINSERLKFQELSLMSVLLTEMLG